MKQLTAKQAQEQAWLMAEQLKFLVDKGPDSEAALYETADKFLRQLMEQGSIEIAVSTVRTWMVDYELALDETKILSSEKFLRLSAVRILQSLPPSPVEIQSFGRRK